MKPRTLLDKVWDAHVVVPATADHPAVLYIDLHLVHEVTSPQAFAVLRERGLKVRRPDRTVATVDHSIPTTPPDAQGRPRFADSQTEAQVAQLVTHCRDFGIELFALQDERQGIVHVVGPEQGLTQPGMTIVCGDSHTSTHGAFGALAFGIGTTQVGHVLATQTLLETKPRSLAIDVRGQLSADVTAKDLILAIIAQIGVGGGTGHVLEYRGSAISALSMEARMTVCNMSIEAGARAGLIAPDDVTFEYVADRPRAPKGAAWRAALERWRSLASDEGARHDRCIRIDASTIDPMVTYGTQPGMAMSIRGQIPEPGDASQREALAYMALRPGRPIEGHPIDVVFIGSCTNGRLSDLQAAARILDGRRVAPGVRMLVVPGSRGVKQQAEALGLDRVFESAGAEWREPGCSMCIGMNGDQVGPGQYAVSTSNRNFKGRQGPGSRTFLAGPLVAAASAVAGRLADPRRDVSADADGSV